MIDPAEEARMRHLWIAVLLNYSSEQIRIFAAAMGDKRSTTLRDLGGEHLATDLDGEIRKARAYLHSRDFQMVCDNAGVQFDPDRALEHMLKMARKVSDNGGVQRSWVKSILAEVA